MGFGAATRYNSPIMEHKATFSSVTLVQVFLLLACGLLACGAPSTPPAETAGAATLNLEGTWRAVLSSPGGELPFGLRFQSADGSDPGEGGASAWNAWVINGEEELVTSSVRVDGQEVVIGFDWYDSEITARMDDDGALRGAWRRTAAEGETSRLPFTAQRPATPRFGALAEAPAPGADQVSDVSGVWRVVFTEDGDDPSEEVARGEFEQEGETVRGTFLTPTGDYRFLDGTYGDGWLRLSTFDGAHAFLFHARVQEDGSLEGDFWSRDVYHATWTAALSEDDASWLPDAWQEVGLTNDEGRLQFTFDDLEGKPLSLADPRFEGKVVVVNIFGSWCPNCNDEAPLLADWHRRYQDQGLEIVGLAYEFSGDPERDRSMVQRFGERHGIDYPLLLAGTSDKAAAAATLPDLTAVLAYPTTVFIARDGRVRRIHSGFSGPGTGVHHERLVDELEQTVESLLAEDVETARTAG